MDLYCCVEHCNGQPKLGALDNVVATGLNVDLCENIPYFLVLGCGDTKAVELY